MWSKKGRIERGREKKVEETWQQLKHVHLQKREGKAARLVRGGWEEKRADIDEIACIARKTLTKKKNETNKGRPTLWPLVIKKREEYRQKN